MSLQKVITDTAFAVAAAVGRSALRWSRRRVGAVLVFHAVDERCGDRHRELVAPHGSVQFAAHVRHVRRSYRPVLAGDILEAVANRRRGERVPVAITFDDDLPSHVHTALPLLQAHDAAATFFLTGASLERPSPFWWERLDRAVAAGIAPETGARLAASIGCRPEDLAPGTIRAVGDHILSLPPAARTSIDRELARLPGPEPRGLAASDVRALVAAGHEIGFHTRDHHPLTTLDAGELAKAMRRGRDELAAAAGHPPRAIAYPHGRADARVADAARAAGYTCGFTTQAEPVTDGSHRWLLGRLTPSYASGNRFRLELVATLVGVPSRRHLRRAIRAHFASG